MMQQLQAQAQAVQAQAAQAQAAQVAAVAAAAGAAPVQGGSSTVAIAANGQMVDLQNMVDTMSVLDEESLVQVISSVLMARPEAAPPVMNFSIPDLTYPPSRALTERRGKGVIKSFNSQAGFGFIQCEELHAVFGNDVFLHQKQLGEFGPGATVTFAVCLSKDNKPQAYDLMAAGPGRTGKGGPPSWGCPGDWQSQDWQFPDWWGGDGWWGGYGYGGWGCGGGKPQQMPHHSQMFGPSDQMKGKGWPFKGGSGKSKGSDDTGGMAITDGAGAAHQCKRPYGLQPQAGGKPDEQIELGQHIGVIKSFNPENGYGFISCTDLQEKGYSNDVFLHHQQVGQCRVGDEVFFTVYLNSKGQPQARDLETCDGQLKGELSGRAIKRPRSDE